MERNNKFKINNKFYKIKVGTYDDTKALKVSVVNSKTKKITEVTTEGVELTIPSAPTPDCVIVNPQKHKEIIDRLLELKILDYCNSIFAKFNVERLAEYDLKGTMEFIKHNATRIEYEEKKANSFEEVKRNIKKDTRELMSNKDVKKYVKNFFYGNKYHYMYSLLNKMNPKKSIAVICDEEGETVSLVYVYIKGIENKFEVYSNWEFSYEETLLSFLENKEYQPAHLDKYEHHAIWHELSDIAKRDEIEYKKGFQRYLKYCKQKGINKKTIDNKVTYPNTPDIMKYYKKEKNKEKGR